MNAERLPLMAFSDGPGHDDGLAPSALILPLEHRSAFFPSSLPLCSSHYSTNPPPPSAVASSFPLPPLLLSCVSSCFHASLLLSLPPLQCAYMFVKIYRSPVVASHSHACSVSPSHSSVHKTQSLWPDIKEKGGKEKRERFSSVP